MISLVFLKQFVLVASKEKKFNFFRIALKMKRKYLEKNNYNDLAISPCVNDQELLGSLKLLFLLFALKVSHYENISASFCKNYLCDYLLKSYCYS